MSLKVEDVLEFLKDPTHQEELQKLMGTKKKRGRPKKVVKSDENVIDKTDVEEEPEVEDNEKNNENNL